MEKQQTQRHEPNPQWIIVHRHSVTQSPYIHEAEVDSAFLTHIHLINDYETHSAY